MIQGKYLCLYKTDAFKNNMSLSKRTVLRILKSTTKADIFVTLSPLTLERCPGLTHCRLKVPWFGFKSQLVPQDSHPLMGRCVPIQQAVEIWKNHSGRAGRDWLASARPGTSGHSLKSQLSISPVMEQFLKVAKSVMFRALKIELKFPQKHTIMDD